MGQGVPTQWALVLAHPDLESADVSSLRIVGTGASRVPPELVAALRTDSGCRWWCATPPPRPPSVPAPCPVTPTRWWPDRWDARCRAWSWPWSTTTAVRSARVRWAGSDCVRLR